MAEVRLFFFLRDFNLFGPSSPVPNNNSVGAAGTAARGSAWALAKSSILKYLFELIPLVPVALQKNAVSIKPLVPDLLPVGTRFAPEAWFSAAVENWSGSIIDSGSNTYVSGWNIFGDWWARHYDVCFLSRSIGSKWSDVVLFSIIPKSVVVDQGRPALFKLLSSQETAAICGIIAIYLEGVASALR